MYYDINNILHICTYMIYRNSPELLHTRIAVSTQLTS